MCFKDKTEYFSFLVHCSMISLVRDIPKIALKPLILTLFCTFVHDGNIQNDISIDFFQLDYLDNIKNMISGCLLYIYIYILTFCRQFVYKNFLDF